MTLQSSGAISLNDIHIEAGGSSGTLCTINDSDIRGLISKGSGATMSFNEWYGASASVSHQLSTSGTIYTEYDTTSGDYFVNAAVTSNQSSIGISWAGAGYDQIGGYYLALMSSNTSVNIATTLNSTYNNVAWSAGTSSNSGSVTWNDYTFPALGYRIAYYYGIGAQTLYSAMDTGNWQVTYTLYT